MSESPLHRMLNPRSIATVGAGNNPMKMGAIQALSIVKDGFPGKFYPVHPNEQEVFGYKAYPSALDLPEAPDLVMFVLPASLVVSILDDFGKIGTRRAIIITAGFREIGPKGKELEEQLKETAARHGIRFLGPNCMGIINSALPLNVTVCPLAGGPGRLGMASQSGTYITQVLPYLQKRGIRFSKAISVGNEADLDIIDALEYLGADEQTKAVALYIEGLKDGRRFLETARRIVPHKPVVAQYVGGTSAGARAGSSHTGAMAGPDYLYDGLFKQGGVIRVHSVEDLYNQGWILANQPPLKGPRVAVLTNSGGPGSAMANTCSEGGLEVPAFSVSLQEEIRKLIPPQGATGNPVDLTFHMDTRILSSTLPELILKSGEVDGLVMHGLMGSGFLKAIYPHLADLFAGMSEEDFLKKLEQDLEGPASLPGRIGLPVVLSSFFGREDNYTTAFQDHGVPVMDAPEKAARGMVALYRYNLIKEKMVGEPPVLPPQSVEAAGIIEYALQNGLKNLDEYSSKKILAAYGVRISKEGLAHSAEEASAIAAGVGYPVVLKACSPDFTHKTGKGLIYLNLHNEDNVLSAYRAVLDAAGQDIPVLVSKMVSGEREVMAGMFRHPGFGPCVLFGLGGIFAEALKDTTFRVVPLRANDAAEMLEDIRASGVLRQFRGMPAADATALGKILQAVGTVALLHPEITEIDLNPIIISGASPVVADALFVLESRPKGHLRE